MGRTNYRIIKIYDGRRSAKEVLCDTISPKGQKKIRGRYRENAWERITFSPKTFVKYVFLISEYAEAHSTAEAM